MLKSRLKSKPAFQRKQKLAVARAAATAAVRATGVARGRPGFQRTGGFYGRFTGPSAELKFHDLDIDDAAVAVGGTIAQSSCNLIAQGVTESTRVGRKCTIKSINWRWDVTIPNAANMTNGLDTVRIILFLDKQCNGAAATALGILETADYQSFNNLANKSRFRVLMDRTVDINAQAAGGDGAANDLLGIHKSDTFFKTVNLPIEFDSTTGALTEIRSNNIGVLLLGRNGFASFNSKMRLRFGDAGA